MNLSPGSRLGAGIFCGGLALVLATSDAQTKPQRTSAAVGQKGPVTAKPQTHWCAPELSVLTSEVCFYVPSSLERGADSPARPRSGPAKETLVIFLHSLIGARPGAAWDLQRRMALMAKTYGFSMLVPRGRPGLGPGRAPGVLAWPTAPKLQEEHETELISQWQKAQTLLEAQHGSFRRVLMFGFSNGAYYATSLAFREKLNVDGVAVFAGGSGSKLNRVMAARAQRRVPMFVGYGSQDAAHKSQEGLVRLLKVLGWPHRSLRSNVGHTVTDAQVRGALRYLGHPRHPTD